MVNGNLLVSTKAQLGFCMPLFLPSFVLLLSPTITVGLCQGYHQGDLYLHTDFTMMSVPTDSWLGQEIVYCIVDIQLYFFIHNSYSSDITCNSDITSFLTSLPSHPH